MSVCLNKYFTVFWMIFLHLGQSGLITNACDDTACEHDYVEHKVSFSPAFSSTPTVTVGMVAFGMCLEFCYFLILSSICFISMT